MMDITSYNSTVLRCGAVRALAFGNSSPARGSQTGKTLSAIFIIVITFAYDIWTG